MSLTARAVRVAAIATTAAATLAPGTAMAASGGPATPVPPGYKANAVTFLPAKHGWSLGAAPCGAKTCSDVIGTGDGGKTWHLAGAVGAPITNLSKNTLGVAEIRFATPAVGWAFGPRLFGTGNGGRTWTAQPVPGNAKQVLALAASPSFGYAVTSYCTIGKALCRHQLGLWRISTKPGSGWARIPLDLPANDAANVAVLGSTVYVVDNQLLHGRPDKFYASTDGTHFSARPAPCSHAKDLALLQAVPMSAARVAVLCDGDPGFSKAVKTVYVSADTGRSYTFAGRTGLFGIQAQLAASPSGNLAVASSSDGSFIYVNDTRGGRTWTMVVGLGDGGAGWNDLAYVNNSTAWVVYGPAGFSGIGQLRVTHDAGQHWAQVTP